jgi:hypothetical protein
MCMYVWGQNESQVSPCGSIAVVCVYVLRLLRESVRLFVLICYVRLCDLAVNVEWSKPRMFESLRW